MGIDHQKIKALRLKLKLTQEEAAKAAGMSSRQGWNRIETGRHTALTVPTLEAIAEVLKVKAKDLLK